MSQAPSVADRWMCNNSDHGKNCKGGCIMENVQVGVGWGVGLLQQNGSMQALGLDLRLEYE